MIQITLEEAARVYRLYSEGDEDTMEADMLLAVNTVLSEKEHVAFEPKNSRMPFPVFNLGPEGETAYQTYHRGFKDGWTKSEQSRLDLIGELRPCGMYAVRITENVPEDIIKRVAAELSLYASELDLRFVLFLHNMEFISPPEPPPSNWEKHLRQSLSTRLSTLAVENVIEDVRIQAAKEAS